ncbi:MAG: type II toxin-antitoxin system RelB/DinJ family antitoxin [Proteobacteria bacterium]|nr:type II toxin-antitoxin system RelB/DinJ family antitoxin [Pseudomonadota bacterium]
MTTATGQSMKSAGIRSRTEPDLKEGASRVLAECRLNLSDAIQLFLRQVVVKNGLPFEVKVPNATTRAAIDEAMGKSLPRFNSVNELFDDLEKAAKRKTR